jgi:endonuclease/exonuclease/phosphatase family metal-dependent hydrolase
MRLLILFFIFAISIFCKFDCNAKSPSKMRIATFNIRLDTPVDGINTWSLRKDSVCQFMQKNNLAIFGLQEVKHNQLIDLQQCMSNYTSVGTGRDDGKEGGEYSPVFYDRRRFDMLESNTFWLSTTPDVAGSKGWDAAFPRVVTWVKLKDKNTRKMLFVFNTHFDHLGVEARKNSALLIHQKVAEIADNEAVVIMGDFNSTVHDDAYQTMIATKTGFVDARQKAKTKVGESWSFHGFGQVKLADRELIDFIFVNRKIQVLRHEIPFIEYDGRYLSDHNPVIADVSY